MYRNILIVVSSIFLDYLSKSWIVNKLFYHQSIEIFKHKIFGLNLFLTYNSGIAFGLFNNLHNYQNVIFMGLNTLIIISLIFMILSKKIVDHLEMLAIFLILSGALGNLIDRVIYGHVIDFIDFYIKYKNKTFHWYTFNIADSMICLGTFLFAYRSFKAIKI